MTVFLLVSSAAMCLSSLIAIIWLVRRATRAAGLPLAKLRSIESRIESLESSVSEWSQTTTDLANSIKMQRVRKAAKLDSSDQVTSKPDPYKDPDGWRKATNLELARRRLAGVVNN